MPTYSLRDIPNILEISRCILRLDDRKQTTNLLHFKDEITRYK